MAEAQTHHALQQIADALGIPVSALTDPHAARAHAPIMNAMLEAAELLGLFERISDEQRRHECIEFVRKMTLRESCAGLDPIIKQGPR